MSYQQEAVSEWVWVVGRDVPDQEWVLSPFDTWHKNPHYTGKPGRHPEDDYEDQTDYDQGPNGEIWGFGRGER